MSLNKSRPVGSAVRLEMLLRCCSVERNMTKAESTRKSEHNNTPEMTYGAVLYNCTLVTTCGSLSHGCLPLHGRTPLILSRVTRVNCSLLIHFKIWTRRVESYISSIKPEPQSSFVWRCVGARMPTDGCWYLKQTACDSAVQYDSQHSAPTPGRDVTILPLAAVRTMSNSSKVAGRYFRTFGGRRVVAPVTHVV